MSLAAGTRLGPYEIADQLGAGGMGEVYRATDTRLDRTVAIKVLPEHLADDQDSLRRFLHEAKAASKLNHPNVCTIYDVGEEKGVRFIAMELVEGTSLKDRIDGKALGLSEILKLGRQIAEALAEAGSHGITHRDIKPANVMINRRGEVKVLDFGLAKQRRVDEETVSINAATETVSGTLVGTVPYMSPEQVLGQKVDPRSDIFSTGTVLYEMATGQRPFRGSTLGELIHQITSESHTRPTERNAKLPGALDEVVDKCLAKDPEARYQNAQQLVADLEALEKKNAPDSRWRSHRAAQA